ncbi:dynamin family protein [Thauera sp. SDU_THAU2]|uniref:dynamin family protein n=1 Tax=Thauera sp. SDU_THAU2 TaxID=3136633 RepID=UPI00311F8A8D
MHKTNIEILRDEAKRQLHQLKSLLQKAQQKGLVEPPATDRKSRATFDTESLPKVLEVLDGETHKLEHLEMVLAVVGTMKAGKSTSINAIVGAEVLPNRNRAMTTLPTLIRHTPGVLRPRLIFEKVEPLNKLLVVLGKAVKSKSASPEILTKLQGDEDMVKLLDQIQQETVFVAQQEGEKEIFHFLKSLNDLVRLCSELEVDFPFSEYATVDAMPVIEVEFSHLKNMPVTQGRLTLLDTPGPNEAGQQHLRHMLKDQLKKSSAVLAVLDYTQLKSDADAQVRENLMEVSDTAKGRMYALVNKFDQKDRNSDDEVTVKRCVAQTLMKGAIAEEHVFPVSSSLGYLASRARNEIERNGRLPNHESWVSDFGKKVFGQRWEKFIDDPKEAKEGADEIWLESGFARPLEQVIVEAHQNAALEALRSAASKLAGYAKDTGDFFKANAGALKRSAADLQTNIDNLHQDIEKISRIENAIEKTLEDALKNVQNRVKGAAEGVRKEVSGTLEDYFREGKGIERASSRTRVVKVSGRTKRSGAKMPQKKQEPESEPKGVLNRLINSFSSMSEKIESSSVQDFDPSSPIIKFNRKSDASDFLKRVEKSIRNAMRKAEDDFKICIQDGVNDFSYELELCRADSLEKIKKSVQKNVDGFDIEIRLPNVQAIKLDVSVSGIVKNAVKEKTKKIRKYRRQSGVWGTVCSWFDTDDWGWEDYEVDKKYYQVDLKRINMLSNKGIESIFSSACSALNNEIYPQLQQGVEEFFCAFREKVEHVRGDLMGGIQKHSLDQARKAEVLKDFTQMAQEASGLEADCGTLNDSAEVLRREEGVSTARSEELV